MPQPGDPSEAPKIIVDTDWKSQAQAEKQRLAAEEAKSKPKPAAPGSGPGESPTGTPGEVPAPPEANFDELMRLLTSQALLYMGAYPDPETGRAVVSLELAKLHIDLLGVLEEKTKNNLSEREAGLLTRTLYELRMHYVEMTKAVAKAVQEGRIGPRAAAAPPPAAKPG
jgi:hypothetical protein